MSARILVVDDESNIRMMIRLALRHIGHQVETAADGPEGLEKFGDGAGWDLVLLDQRMPGMEGLEVLREMRRRNGNARVIMITAFGTIDLAVAVMKAGATDFLRKPFAAETLRNAVQSALGEMPAERGAADTLPFSRAAINGFRIECRQAPGEMINGERRHHFTVFTPAGEKNECTVALPAYITELVKAHADREDLPGGERFWQSLCEEALANYLWQYAELPANGFLAVTEFTSGLRRFVNEMLASGE